ALMAAPRLSQQLKERIVFWREVEHHEIQDIVELAGCKERAIYNVLRTYHEFGTVQNLMVCARGRPRLLKTGDMNYLSSLLHANPMLYLDEIQEQL
ncbi:hypothetical protein BKA93DRAFT_720621, partial [Sparassis latifolia]